jgi:hypothetical protein
MHGSEVEARSGDIPVDYNEQLMPRSGMHSWEGYNHREGRVSMSWHPDLHILSNGDDIQFTKCLLKQNVIVKKRSL